MRNTINFFEIPATDFKRAVKFYSEILKTEIPVTDIMNYDMGFLLAEPGAVGGAIVHGEGYIPSHHGSLIYLNCEPDLQIVLERVEKAGGHIVVPKTLIKEEVGYFAFITDTEGNKIALHSMR